MNNTTKVKEPIESKVYTVSDIQNILNMSKGGVYNFIKYNPPFKVFKVGNLYRISKKSFDEWLEKEMN